MKLLLSFAAFLLSPSLSSQSLSPQSLQVYNYANYDPELLIEPRAGVECGYSVFKENLAKTSGSRLALPGEFPWQVTLHNSDFDSPDHECSGTIISENYILTAAHCLNEFESARELKIVAGHLRAKDQRIIRKAAKVIIHSLYDPLTNENDIGLVKVTEPFDFVNTKGLINAACLPPPSLEPGMYIRGDLTVAGFGSAMESGEATDHLIAVNVPMIDLISCRSMYGSDQPLRNMICAGSSSAESSLSCSGESGGPLIGRDVDNRAIVLGVSSFGYGCPTTGFPAVYTDVRKFIDWIVTKAT